MGGAFFVPLHPGDVAVHGWDVVHGVHVKELQTGGKNGDFKVMSLQIVIHPRQIQQNLHEYLM